MGCVVFAVPVQAQLPIPKPSPTPPATAPPSIPSRLQQAQDELNFQTRTNVFLGSGARALGMAGAFLARADDASAASWNPAGLSYLLRPEFSIVGARTVFDANSTDEPLPLSNQPMPGQPVVLLPPGKHTDQLRRNAPDFAAAAYPIRIGSFTGAVQLSFQRVIPLNGFRRLQSFDLIEDPNTGELVIHKQTQDTVLQSEGGFDTISLGTGLQLSHRVRVGGTFNRWFNGYHLNYYRYRGKLSSQEVDLKLAGWNVNLGLIFSPFEGLNFGVVGKTSFDANVTLSRKRNDACTVFFPSSDQCPRNPITGEDDAVTQNQFRRDDLSLHLPGSLGLGASWRLLNPLTLSADYTQTFWSQAQITNFFTLPPAPPDGSKPTPQVGEDFFPNPLPYPTLDNTRPQENSKQFRVGVEYVLVFDKLKIPLRAGYLSDGQYFRVTQAPGTEVAITRPGATPEGTTLHGGIGKTPRLSGYAFGAGIHLGPMLFDAAYLLEQGTYQDVSSFGVDDAANPIQQKLGTTTLKARRILFSLIYRYGSRP